MDQEDDGDEDRCPRCVEQRHDGAAADVGAHRPQVAKPLRRHASAHLQGVVHRPGQYRPAEFPVEPASHAGHDPSAQGIQQAEHHQRHRHHDGEHEQRVDVAGREHAIVELHHVDRDGEHQHVDARAEQRDRDPCATACGHDPLELVRAFDDHESRHLSLSSPTSPNTRPLRGRNLAIPADRGPAANLPCAASVSERYRGCTSIIKDWHGTMDARTVPNTLPTHRNPQAAAPRPEFGPWYLSTSGRRRSAPNARHIQSAPATTCRTRMRILILHNDFPAQFGLLCQYLVSQGHDVTYGSHAQEKPKVPLRMVRYQPHRNAGKRQHPYLVVSETAVLNGQALARVGWKLKAEGYSPDVILAHSYWGPGLFVRDVWPDTKYVGYFEWYYRPDGPNAGFLWEMTRNDRLRSRMSNAPILIDVCACHWGIVPTEFQASQFPGLLRRKLTVQHDGVDTVYYAPVRGRRLKLPGSGPLAR